MLKINILIIIYFLLIHISSLAQATDPLKSKIVVNNQGLIFENEVEYKLNDSSYTEVIQLLNLCDKAQAIQFRILINKSTDDNVIIILKDIQKGSDLSDPSWLIDYNLIKGPINKNGASQDEVYVVLYNQNLNGGLLPGDYKNLINVNYQLADMTGLQNNIKSSMRISSAEASTFQGVAIDITPSRDELKIYLKRM